MGRAKDYSAYRLGEMPTVGGASIVESGSNTDGEWIKYSDGTQICTLSKEVSATGFYYFSLGWYAPYPIPFLSTPSIHGTFSQTGDVRNIVHSAAHRGYNGSPGVSETEWSFQVKFSSHGSTTSITSGLAGYAHLQALGRWK